MREAKGRFHGRRSLPLFSPKRFSVCNEGFDCSFFLVWDVIYVIYINIWYNSKAVFIAKNKCLYALLILEAFCAVLGSVPGGIQMVIG